MHGPSGGAAYVSPDAPAPQPFRGLLGGVAYTGPNAPTPQPLHGLPGGATYADLAPLLPGATCTVHPSQLSTSYHTHLPSPSLLFSSFLFFAFVKKFMSEPF